MKPPRAQHILFWCVTLLLAVGALYYACHGIRWHAVLTTIHRANPALLWAGCAIASLSYFVRGCRWRVLLSAERLLPVSTVFFASMVGYLGNSYLPARAGEVLRSALLGRRAGISAAFIFATALTERVGDVIALVLISMLALPLVPHLPAEFLLRARLLGWCALSAIAVALLVCAYRHAVVNGLARLPCSTSIRLRLARMADQFLLGARSIQHLRRALVFIGMTCVIWTLDATSSVVAARALHLTLSFPQACILLTALGLASALPSTPGALGIFQLVAVAILVPFGLSKDNALAYILVSQAFGYLVITAWGVLGLWGLRQGSLPSAEAGRPLPRTTTDA